MEQVYEKERHALVENLRSKGYVKSPRTESAMRAVPRERFIPTHLTHRAYDDEPLSIGLEQTISAPHMVAIMTEAVQAAPGMRILEIGTGSGYQAAVLGRVVGASGRVVSVERIKTLAERARLALVEADATNVKVCVGDGSLGRPTEGPFDRILVTASAPDIPPPLLEQLAPDGVLVIPVGGRECDLVRVRKTTTGFEREVLGACAFVPLLGAHGQDPARFFA